MNDQVTADAAAPAPKPEKPAKIKKNGITRPGTDTMIGALWAIADEESAKLGAPAMRDTVIKRFLAEHPAAAPATANTQYARWVTFNGAGEILKARRKEELAAAKAEKDKESAEKAAEKERVKAEKEAEKQAKAKAKEERAAAKAAEAEAKAKAKAEKAAAVEAEKAVKAKAAAEAAAAKAAEAQNAAKKAAAEKARTKAGN